MKNGHKNTAEQGRIVHRKKIKKLRKKDLYVIDILVKCIFWQIYKINIVGNQDL